MTDPKTAARTVATRLAQRQIAVKHVQALDLVAAGVGLASRHLLAGMKQLPAIRRVNAALLASAASVLARHDLARRQVIVDETSEALLPAADAFGPNLASIVAGRAPETPTDGFADLPLRRRVDLALEALDALSPTYAGEEGDRPIDYVRLASVLRAASGVAMDPITLAVLDGADRLRDLLPSLSEDPDTAGGIVREWCDDVERADLDTFGPESISALLEEGGNAVGGILAWLPKTDRLRAWFDVAIDADSLSGRHPAVPVAPADGTVAAGILGIVSNDLSVLRPIPGFAELALRERIDMIVSAIDADEGGFDGIDLEGHEPETVGEMPLDYDRIAAVMKEAAGSSPDPLTLSIQDGADRIAAFTRSTPAHESALVGLNAWLDATAIPNLARLAIPKRRALLDDGAEVVGGILHWLDDGDRLHAWFDVAMYPSALGTRVDLEGSGVASTSIELEGVGLRIPLALLDGTMALEASPWREQLVDAVVKDVHFSAWERDTRYPLESGAGVKIAAAAIDAKRSAKTDEDRRLVDLVALSAHFRPSDAEDQCWTEVRSNVQSILDEASNVVSESDIDCDWDRDEFEQVLADAAFERLRRDDTSKIDHLLSSGDRVEILFHVRPENTDVEEMCRFKGPFQNPKEVVVDDRFLHGLAFLGWSLGEWRELTGSKMENHSRRRWKPRAEKLVDGHQLVELIENACSDSFEFALYGYVPVQDVLAADLGKELELGEATLAVYNPMAGTFQDIRLKHPVAFRDGLDGELSTTDWCVSPDDICGLVMSCYESSLRDPEHHRRSLAATEAMKVLMAVDALTMATPGRAPAWTATDPSGLVLEASVGTYDARRGYSPRAFRATFSDLSSEIPEVESIVDGR